MTHSELVRMREYALSHHPHDLGEECQGFHIGQKVYYQGGGGRIEGIIVAFTDTGGTQCAWGTWVTGTPISMGPTPTFTMLRNVAAIPTHICAVCDSPILETHYLCPEHR